MVAGRALKSGFKCFLFMAVLLQVIGGSSSDEDGEDDSGLALQEFRKRHNLDIQQLRREAMTPPALDGDPDRPLDDGGHDPLYDCIIDDDNFEVSSPPHSLVLNERHMREKGFGCTLSSDS